MKCEVCGHDQSLHDESYCQTCNCCGEEGCCGVTARMSDVVFDAGVAELLRMEELGLIILPNASFTKYDVAESVYRAMKLAEREERKND